MRKLINKIKRSISIIEAIKHDVAIKMHYDDYQMLRNDKSSDKSFAMKWINIRIKHWVKTGEFDNNKEIFKKLFPNGKGREVDAIRVVRG